MANPIAAILGMEVPRMSDEDMKKHRDWQMQFCRSAFAGDDDDATAARDMLDRIESWYALLGNHNKHVYTSRLLTEALTPYAEAIPKVMDELVQIAVLRAQALGIVLPEHPLDRSEDSNSSGFNTNGWMPPMGNAG